MSPVHVTKYSGESEVYDESKLRRSLKQAGAAPDIIDEIAESISNELYEGISTQKIYKEAFRQLKAESQKTAGRYKLKEALFELGPTGYPFERFIAELLNRRGYVTEIGITVQGDCVSHEIDVIAEKENHYYLVECKFHNRKENRCNVQVPLYIQSRFLDVKKNWTQQPGHAGKKHRGYVVTNTRFTQDAIRYAECIGLELLSWDYPKNNGLKDLIGQMNLHPVTCLTSIEDHEIEKLLKNDIVLAVQIAGNRNLLKEAGISSRRINRIQKEAENLITNSRVNHA